MKRARETVFSVGDETRRHEVFQALAKRFRFREEAVPRASVIYHDTFDWRIFKDGGLIATETSPRGAILTWRSFAGTIQHWLQNAELQEAGTPDFAWNFPAGPFREALEPIIEMRRLSPVVDLHTTAIICHVLDSNDKTVVRLRLEDRSAQAPGGDPIELPSLLKVQSLRGYDAARDRAVTFLAEKLGLEETSPDWRALLRAGGREPGEYSSKVRLELDPTTPASIATRQIHRNLLQTLRINEDGVRKDLDSEFLHDFRVAVRRTRSALSQIKGVFPTAALDHFKREFAWLGRITGPTRDLDVYLLKIDDYEAALPEKVREHLEPLRDFLAVQQRREQKKVVAGLDSERYPRLLADWQIFLDGDGPWADAATDTAGAPEDEPAYAESSILEVAGKRIWKVYRRVLKDGEAIQDDTPDESLHDLRIVCKKLRYLMEFFKSLYPGSAISDLIKELKNLQTNLGDFNDYSVQQEQLRDFAGQMLDEGLANADTALAMGRLVGRLEEGHAAERRAFHERFERFAQPRNRERFRALFKG